MKDFDPGKHPTVEISTRAAAGQHWAALPKETLPKRSVLLYTDHLSEAVELGTMLATGLVLAVQVAGDAEEDGVILDFSFVQALRAQCIRYDVPFHFAGTGSRFRMNGRVYHIPKKLQAVQAAKAGMEYFPICRAMNPPICKSAEAAARSETGEPAAQQRISEKDAAPQVEPEDRTNSPNFELDGACPSIQNLHFPIEISDEEDGPGASEEELAEIEKNERQKKKERAVEFRQEALSFATEDGK